MVTFFIEGLKHLYQVGTVFPSSPWFARAMTQSVRRDRPPKRILEIGPGTGGMTRLLLSSLNDGDEFHIVERNPVFCRHLETRLLHRFRAAHPDVRVYLYCRSIETAPIRGQFDFIICSLPFRAFSPRVVRLIFDKLVALMADNSELTYMEYARVRSMKSPFVRRSRRWELCRIDAFCRSLQRRYNGSRTFVVLNILPSVAVRLISSPQRRAASRPQRRLYACPINGTKDQSLASLEATTSNKFCAARSVPRIWGNTRRVRSAGWQLDGPNHTWDTAVDGA